MVPVLTDIASLRWSQIDYSDQTITFTRNKTSRTRRGNQIKVVASLFPESRTIIDRWAGGDRVQSGYVFPFLTDGMDARRKKVTIIQLINITNKYMKRIAKALSIQVEIKTYEARHSFASAILKGGGDLNFIKDKLGQSSLKSTEAAKPPLIGECTYSASLSNITIRRISLTFRHQLEFVLYQCLVAVGPPKRPQFAR